VSETPNTAGVSENAADAAAPSEPAKPPSASATEVPLREKRFEVVATVLLGLTALATAWSGYQAALWDGIQSSNYSQASALRVESAQQLTEANQFRLADLSVFENYIDATLEGETDLADFYRQRFRDEFEPAFDAWQATDPLTNPDAPASPLAMPEYRLAADDRAEGLATRAEATFTSGEKANDYSDTYVATTLSFAAVLFFAAISERFAYAPARATLLSLATVGLAVGLVIMATQPVTSG